ncbi:unnamed protein product [Nezara viridula]|uniref:Uncharacterized protein n=1 Tax=Nezara viridula TaxID=85310 RepID=A0A9P0HDN1_NEZVI|nr:unnamed protein product [Nezara viridula]
MKSIPAKKRNNVRESRYEEKDIRIGKGWRRQVHQGRTGNHLHDDSVMADNALTYCRPRATVSDKSLPLPRLSEIAGRNNPVSELFRSMPFPAIYTPSPAPRERQQGMEKLHSIS